MNKNWTYKMWYYTKKEAQGVASKLKKQGYSTKITRSKNYNQPEEGGKYKYDVYYRNK